MHGLIAGGAGGKQEDEGWAHWAAEHIGLGLVSGIPVVRDVASALGHGMEYRPTPAADAIVKLGHAAKDAARALELIEGGPSDRSVRHAIEAPGYFLGLPTGQAAGAGQFLWDTWHGNEDPRGVAEWMRPTKRTATPSACNKCVSYATHPCVHEAVWWKWKLFVNLLLRPMRWSRPSNSSLTCSCLRMTPLEPDIA